MVRMKTYHMILKVECSQSVYMCSSKHRGSITGTAKRRRRKGAFEFCKRLFRLALLTDKRSSNRTPGNAQHTQPVKALSIFYSLLLFSDHSGQGNSHHFEISDYSSRGGSYTQPGRLNYRVSATLPLVLSRNNCGTFKHIILHSYRLSREYSVFDAHRTCSSS